MLVEKIKSALRKLCKALRRNGKERIVLTVAATGVRRELQKDPKLANDPKLYKKIVAELKKMREWRQGNYIVVDKVLGATAPPAARALRVQPAAMLEVRGLVAPKPAASRASKSAAGAAAMPTDRQIKTKMKQLFEQHPERHYYNIPAAAKNICKLLDKTTSKCEKHVVRRLNVVLDTDSTPRRAGSRIYPS